MTHVPSPIEQSNNGGTRVTPILRGVPPKPVSRNNLEGASLPWMSNTDHLRRFPNSNALDVLRVRISFAPFLFDCHPHNCDVWGKFPNYPVKKIEGVPNTHCLDP